MDASTATSIFLQWDPPLLPNGIIIDYEITFHGVQTPNVVDIANFTSARQLRTGTVTSFNLTVPGGLMPGSSYAVSIQAATSAGFGPSSNTIVAVTSEAGEYTIRDVHYKLKLICSTTFELTFAGNTSDQ